MAGNVREQGPGDDREAALSSWRGLAKEVIPCFRHQRLLSNQPAAINSPASDTETQASLGGEATLSQRRQVLSIQLPPLRVSTAVHGFCRCNSLDFKQKAPRRTDAGLLTDHGRGNTHSFLPLLDSYLKALAQSTPQDADVLASLVNMPA